MQSNNMSSKKNMTLKQMTRAIINHRSGYMSKKAIHVKIAAMTKAYDAILREREKKKKKISKAQMRRTGKGLSLIGTDYLPDRDYNCPIFTEGFLEQQIYEDDMRWMTPLEWDAFLHAGDDTTYDDDNEWRYHISDIDPEEEVEEVDGRDSPSMHSESDMYDDRWDD